MLSLLPNEIVLYNVFIQINICILQSWLTPLMGQIVWSTYYQLWISSRLIQELQEMWKCGRAGSYAELLQNNQCRKTSKGSFEIVMEWVHHTLWMIFRKNDFFGINILFGAAWNKKYIGIFVSLYLKKLQWLKVKKFGTIWSQRSLKIWVYAHCPMHHQT